MQAAPAAHAPFRRSASWLQTGRGERSGPVPSGSIKATSVLQPILRVEAEEVGRALRAIGARHLLGRIDYVGKGEVVTLCERLHVVAGVLGIGLCVIWHDSDRTDADST